ncbi:ABC transporter ATP-binding protein [Brevibacterium gallinarum]|uniref:ABC transporter ATP-binding protein n=1 Tax=Brevibacterium gallinarum TaxID=2762220 RepID=A0ABR8WSJ5_9MICO|nr:ABC transporter ATP-binding protein [Brevibacterium gallinarum]MBD8019858.1 ABC transporter ATP-binding protein [Brevibacterium gallinarum]
MSSFDTTSTGSIATVSPSARRSSAWHARAQEGGNVLEIDDLHITATASGADVISDVELDLKPSEILALVGESGSGKTTVGLAVLGHFRTGLTHACGTVWLYPSDADEPAEMTALPDATLRQLRGARVSYIPQDPALSLNPGMRVGEQISEVLDIHGFGSSAEERAERVRSVLREVGLPDDEAYQRRWPHQLSGGQQQRIGIAMAFAMYPDVLVLDEPTTGLDVATQAQVLDTIREMTVRNKVAGLYITHDLAVVAEIADRIAVMLRGRIVEQGGCADVLERPQHDYTKTLLAAVPDLAGRNRIGDFERADVPADEKAAAEARATAAEENRKTHLLTTDATHASPAAEAATASGPETGTSGTAGPETGTASPETGTSGTGGATAASEVSERQPTAPATDAVLQVRGLGLSYGPKTILESIDLDLRAGECTLLLGESGSGKTTLARSIAGLNDGYTGDVIYRGETIARSTRQRSIGQRTDIQYIFQSPFSSLNPRRTIGESLAVPLEMAGGLSAAQRREQVKDALDAVRLGRQFHDRRPGDLSGGERQRAAIARALVNMPSVLICDEITSALDVSVQASIISLLRTLQDERGLAMLFVTHNIALARHIASRVAVLNAGRIVDDGPVDAVLENPQHTYTQELLANVPSL